MIKKFFVLLTLLFVRDVYSSSIASSLGVPSDTLSELGIARKNYLEKLREHLAKVVVKNVTPHDVSVSLASEELAYAAYSALDVNTMQALVLKTGEETSLKHIPFNSSKPVYKYDIGDKGRGELLCLFAVMNHPWKEKRGPEGFCKHKAMCERTKKIEISTYECAPTEMFLSATE